MMIFCYGETNLFPESDFLHTNDGVIFQPPIHIHHVQREHWATTGVPIDPANIPGVVSYNRVQGIVELNLIETTIDDTPGVLGEE